MPQGGMLICFKLQFAKAVFTCASNIIHEEISSINASISSSATFNYRNYSILKFKGRIFFEIIYNVVCPYVTISGCPSVCRISYFLSVCLSVYLAVWLSVGLSVCLSVCLSVYLSVCLSLSVSVCLCVCVCVCVC